jgi:outer membrane protein assembly factor BamE
MIVAQMRVATAFPRGFSRACAISLASVMLFAAGCSRAPVPMPEFVKPYRMTIQQGNFVTREMVEQLKPGMTKEQVRFILGTPLLTDIFHADRWDYTFYRDMPGAKREQRNFSVIFEDQKLSRVVGDLLPEPGSPAPSKPSAADTAPRPVSPAPKDERGFFGRLFGPSSPPKPAAPAEPPAPAAPEAKPQEEKQAQGQNWGIAEQPPAPAPAKAEEKPATKPAAERGFFDRLFGRSPAQPAPQEEKQPEAQK